VKKEVIMTYYYDDGDTDVT